MRKRLLLGGVTLLVVAAGIGAAYVWSKWEAAQDVRGSSTEEFVTTEEVAPAPPPPPPDRSHQAVVWPMYRYDAARHGVSPWDHRPPFGRRWIFGARSLVEFPPAIAHGRLYFSNNVGVLFAVNAKTGRRAWRVKSGRCVASTPAVSDSTVFQAYLYEGACTKQPKRPDGEVVAYASGFGKVRWRKRIGASETSPLLVDGKLYVGDWNGKVWALDAASGDTLWTFQTKGKVKAALTLSGGHLYAASYDHHLYALDVRNGKPIWRAKVQPRLGKLGTFYSTPAAAYGRVYIGSTDRKVYSYGASSGKLRWSHKTGGFVYGSPTVWRKRVYVGSYDRHFYAFDAATGELVWKFKANGPISGSATVMGGRVYFSTLRGRTYGLDTRTGEELWRFNDGEYSPIVADSDRVYLVGLARIYALQPRDR